MNRVSSLEWKLSSSQATCERSTIDRLMELTLGYIIIAKADYNVLKMLLSIALLRVEANVIE